MEDVVIEKIRSQSITIEPNHAGNVSVSLDKVNFRPIAVSGYSKVGSGTSQCMCYEYWFDDGTLGLASNRIAKAYFRNYGTSAATFTVDFVITYLKE